MGCEGCRTSKANASQPAVQAENQQPRCTFVDFVFPVELVKFFNSSKATVGVAANESFTAISNQQKFPVDVLKPQPHLSFGGFNRRSGRRGIQNKTDRTD
jgi:hypothetical protein